MTTANVSQLNNPCWRVVSFIAWVYDPMFLQVIWSHIIQMAQKMLCFREIFLFSLQLH